jgi:hypothetical protein
MPLKPNKDGLYSMQKAHANFKNGPATPNSRKKAKENCGKWLPERPK